MRRALGCTCAPCTAWHPLFIGFVRSFLPAGRVLGANIHLAEPRAILGVDLTGHASDPTEVGFKIVGFSRQLADLIIDGEGHAATDAGPPALA